MITGLVHGARMKHDSSAVRGVFNGGQSFDTKAVAWAPQTSAVPALNYKNQLLDFFFLFFFFIIQNENRWLEALRGCRAQTGRAAVGGTNPSGSEINEWICDKSAELIIFFILFFPPLETVQEGFFERMHRTSGWIGWALCLCASLTVSAQDYPETDEMILDLIRGDGTRPETGAEPAADFLRCNKVMKRGGGSTVLWSVTLVEIATLQSTNTLFFQPSE